MRLAHPVYETLPLTYMAIGVLAVAVAYLDPAGARGMLAFSIGIVAEVAALTIFLRRQDYRALRREYSGGRLELPPTLDAGSPTGLASNLELPLA